MTPASPPRRRFRWVWLTLLGVCLGVSVLAAALVAQRRALAHALIEAQLHALGLEEVAHRVERVGLRHFAARDLRIGANSDLVVERIDARYSLASLMAGRLDLLEVRGVRLRGRIDAGGPSFGSLDPLIASREAPAGATRGASPTSVALPARSIVVADAVVSLATPEGPFELHFDANLGEAPQGGLRGDANFTGEGAGASVTGRVEAEGTASHFSGTADLVARHPDGSATARVVAEGTPAELAARADVVAELPEGSATAHVEATGTPAGFSGTAELSAELPQGVATARIEATGTPSDFAGTAHLSAELPEGRVTARVDAKGTPADISVTADVDAQLPKGSVTARVDAAGAPAALSGDVRLLLRGGGPIEPGYELVPVEVPVAARFEVSDQRLTVATSPVDFDAAIVRSGERLRFAGTLPASVLRIPGSDASRIAFEASGGHVTLHGARVELRDLQVAGRLDAATGMPVGTLRIGSVSDLDRPARVIPLAVTATVGADAGRATFDVQVSGAGQRLVVTLGGSHDPATGSGSARWGMKPLLFAPGGLQPAALFPRLGATVASASGSVEALGKLSWSADAAPQAQIDLAARDLSVDSVDGSFERLNAAVRFDGPSPLSTPPGQLVSMARIDFGLELQNGLIEFRLRPDEVIELTSAQWSLAGGTIRTRGVLDPKAPQQELEFTVADLDLARLLELVDVDGLSGTGTLHGRLPVVRRGPNVEIHGGRLEAGDAGGWIRYRPGSGGAPPAQGVDVLLAALHNFRYTKLVATLDGDTAGPVTVAVKLAGANPDYHNGYPVELNLGVESRLMDLLRNATASYRIPQEIERRLEELSKRRR